MRSENYFGYYFLNGKNPVRCKDIKEWTIKFRKDSRNLVKTEWDGLTISTVFLGINYQYEEGDLIIFETMAFRTPECEPISCERYSNWDDAIAGHIKMCRKFFGEYDESDLFLDKL